jgi:hypothetical protein
MPGLVQMSNEVGQMLDRPVLVMPEEVVGVCVREMGRDRAGERIWGLG